MFPSDVCDYIPRTVEEWVINIPSMLDARVAISMVDREDADVALGKTYLNTVYLVTLQKCGYLTFFPFLSNANESKNFHNACNMNVRPFFKMFY